MPVSVKAHLKLFMNCVQVNLSEWSKKLQREVSWIEDRIAELIDMMQEDAES